MEESRVLQLPDNVLHIHVKLCRSELSGAHAIGQSLVPGPRSGLTSAPRPSLLPLSDVVEAVGAIPGAQPHLGLGVGPQGRVLKSSGAKQFVVGILFRRNRRFSRF